MGDLEKISAEQPSYENEIGSIESASWPSHERMKTAFPFDLWPQMTLKLSQNTTKHGGSIELEHDAGECVHNFLT